MNSIRVLKKSKVLTPVLLQRNIAGCSVLMNRTATDPIQKTATDPIQKLFLEKLKEYTQRSSGGKLVDISPEKQKEFDEVLSNLKRGYGADKGDDFTKFPTFNFSEPKVDPINLEKH